MEDVYKIGINDQNVEIVNAGYHEYLSPVTKLPVFNIGILAKIKVASRRFNRNHDMYVSFWTSMGPNTKALTFNHIEVDSRKVASRTAKFDKKFPSKDLGRLVAERNIDVNDFFSAYHSYLIITDWYSEQMEKGYR